jgi:hypothetical protein
MKHENGKARNSSTVAFTTLVQLTALLLPCSLAVLAQSPGDNTDRFHDARWGVTTYYLGTPPSTADGAEPTADAGYELVLEQAAGDGQPLSIFLSLQRGKVHAAFGVAETYNHRPHDVDASGLAWEGDRLAGEIAVTINPDFWVPADGKPVPCRYRIDAKRSGRRVAGHYTGTFGDEARSGEVAGNGVPIGGPERQRVRMQLYQALRRLAPRPGVKVGPNTNYALDMILSFTWRDGRATGAIFESLVPDYRRYGAIVRKLDVRRDGARWTGTAVIDVDHGEDPQPRIGSGSRFEQYTYTLKGLAMGDAVVGRYDTAVGEIRDTGGFVLGDVDRGPAPQPEDSLAFLRCHGAMRDDYPVVLYLATGKGGKVHGCSYCPGWNHQPHPVDASGLTREGDTLRGSVVVNVRPDCYRKPVVYFDLPVDVEAKITDGSIAGTFTCTDEETSRRGAITGELRPKAPPIATIADLRACELSLGYSLPSGPMPKSDFRGAKPNHCNVRLHFAGGNYVRGEVFNPHAEDAFEGEVGEVDFSLDGDRVAGKVRFEITASPVVRRGAYEFRFQAIVDGDQLVGFWQARENGRPIYTKSAKLGGTLTAAGRD